MSTAYFVWPFLYFLFPLSSLAGPLYTASLPTSVSDRISPCAQECVNDFVVREFSRSCRERWDLDCFCKSDNDSGFTLGEKARKCLEARCHGFGREEIYEASMICGDIPGAKPMTHAALDITQTYTMTPSCPTSTLSTSKRTPTSSFRAPHTRRSTSSTANGISCPTPSPPSITATSATSITTASTSSSATAAAAAKPALTESQIAGIAVGGVACVLVIALSLLFFFCCLRPGRSKKRLSGSSFGNDNSMGSNPVSPTFSPTRNEDPRLIRGVSPQFVPTRNTDSEQAQGLLDFSRVDRRDGFVTPERANAGVTTLKRSSLDREEIGLALGSEARERLTVDETSSSAASHRTTSKLLPDKPSYSLWPPPLRVKHSTSPVSPISGSLPGEAGIGQKGPTPLSRPSPRLGDSPSTSQLQHHRGVSSVHASASDPFLDSHSGPRALTYTSPRRQPLRLETPRSNQPDPEIPTHGQWTQSLDDLRRPVPARHSSSARQLNRQKAACASISPNEYTGRHLIPSPVDRPSHVRRQSQRTKGSNRFGPPMPRYSSASDTNFEDTDDEEGIPPMPTSHRFLPSLPSSGEVAHSKFQGSAASQQFGQRPLPISPTPKPARRNQPQLAPISTQKIFESNGMSNGKALLEVPELPDTPVNPTVQKRYKPSPAISSNADRATDNVRNTAKWQILVAPGLNGIVNDGTPWSQGGSERKPATPPKQAAAQIPMTPSKRC